MNFNLASARKSHCQFGVSGSQATVQIHSWTLVCSRAMQHAAPSTALPDLLLLSCTHSWDDPSEAELPAFLWTAVSTGTVLRAPLQASQAKRKPITKMPLSFVCQIKAA